MDLRSKYTLIQKAETKVPASSPAPSCAILGKASAGLATTKKRPGKGRKGKGKRTKKTPTLPPDLDAGGRQILSVRLRFVAQANITQGSSVTDAIFGALGGIGTVTNSSIACWATAFKLKRITAWTPEGGESTVYWGTGNAGYFSQPDVVHDETLPTGITVTRPIAVSPPKDSWAGMWHSVSETSTVLLYYTFSEGTIVDVELDYTLAAALNPLSRTVATAVLGQAYYLYLDGSTTHKLQPLGRPSTF